MTFEAGVLASLPGTARSKLPSWSTTKHWDPFEAVCAASISNAAGVLLVFEVP